MLWIISPLMVTICLVLSSKKSKPIPIPSCHEIVIMVDTLWEDFLHSYSYDNFVYWQTYKTYITSVFGDIIAPFSVLVAACTALNTTLFSKLDIKKCDKCPIIENNTEQNEQKCCFLSHEAWKTTFP